MMKKMLIFIKQTIENNLPLSTTNTTDMWLLPVKQFIYLEIPLTDFEETNWFQIH